MKNTYLSHPLKFTSFLLLTFFSFIGHSQTNIVMILNNPANISPTEIQFDIWIKNQGTTVEKLSGYSFGISHSNAFPSISNGGVLTFSQIAGSRDPIFNGLDPNPIFTYANKQFKAKTTNVNAVNAAYLQQGVSYKLGRFKVKNTVNFPSNYIANLYLNPAPAPTQMKCIATSYCNGSNTPIGFSSPNGLSLVTNTPGFALNPPSAPVITVIENQPISCHGNNDGSAEATATGNTPITFNVDGGLFTNTSGLFYGLTPGTHTICAKDVNGLTSCGTITFIEPDPLAMTFTIDSMVSCQGNDGSITANITGGTNLLQGYLTWWTNAAGDTLNNLLANNFAIHFDFLPVGFYNVAIEDDHGCFYNQTGYLPAAPPITVSGTFPPIVCHNGTTTITPSAVGGVPYTPLTYKINGLPVAASYPAGTYTITATDAKACTGTTSITIINPPIIQSAPVNVSACNSYTWPANGITYTTAGLYSATLTNASGCDSIAKINLTLVSTTTNGSATVTACNSYTWSLSGLTYTSSGTYVKTSVNASGCLNIATLTLTINQNTTNGNATITACNSYLWNGVTYTATGVYTYTSLNAQGCQNTATLNLTINQNTSNGNLTVTACDFYTWNGVTYQTSGVYTYTSTNAQGCINTATLNLTVNKSPTTNGTIGSNESACGPIFDPAIMNTIIPPTGATGPLQYLWLSSLDGGATFTILYAATNASYDPGPITQTTWYRRCARVAGCSSYTSESNWVMKQVLTCKQMTQNPLIETNKEMEVISSISIQPNPLTEGQEQLGLQFVLAHAGKVQLNLYGIDGALVLKKEIQSNEGANNKFIQLPGMAKGIYYLDIIFEGIHKTNKY